MRASTRDLIVVAVLGLAAILVLLAWQPLGPWVTLGIVVLAALVAIAVYRMRPAPAAHAAADRAPLALRRTDAQ